MTNTRKRDRKPQVLLPAADELLPDEIVLDFEIEDSLVQYELPDVANLEPRIARMEYKRQSVAATKRETLNELLAPIALPKMGECLHIVSNGRFDYFMLVPYLLNRIAEPALELWASTWTMNRQNVAELLEMFDSGKVQSINMMTGTYFKRRESAVANTLIVGLSKRGQRYLAFENHTKVCLLRTPNHALVIEGSANWTANPRLEQNIIVNDPTLLQFHQSWMQDAFNQAETLE